MGFAIDLLKMSGGHVSVDLGGGQIGVPKHLLYGPEVCATFEQVSGERVAQGVGGDVVRQSRLAGVALDDGVKPLPGEPPSAIVQEQLRALRVPGPPRKGRPRSL